jgi:regulator of replication initiation timing
MDDRPSDAQRDPLSAAYEQRTKDLYDARGALAEAVSTLTGELTHCREERERLLEENRGLREHAEALQAEIGKLEDGLAVANQRTAAVQNLKVVRWSAWPRAVLYRIRTGRK